MYVGFYKALFGTTGATPEQSGTAVQVDVGADDQPR